MAKSLVLHLGDPETGATSIQHALKSGAVNAAGVSILYPVPQGSSQNHNAAVRTLIRKQSRPNRAAHFDPISKMVAQSDADVAVLSAENFELADPGIVQRILTKYFADLAPTARLIVYLRPHVDPLLTSFADQITRGLYPGSLDAFYDQYRKDQSRLYAPRLARWRDQFGDRLTVRPMVGSQLVNGDVVQDFVDFLLEGADFSLKPLPQASQDLCVEDLSLLATLQTQVRHVRGDKKSPRKAARMLGGRVARMLETSRKTAGTPLTLHKALADRIAEDYRQDAALVDQLYFTGTPLGDCLQTACDTAVPQAQSLQLEDHLSPANMRLALAWLELIEKLFSVHPDQWPAYFKNNPLIDRA